jgi:hypothetical protein
MSARPQLTLVNTSTGEVIDRDPRDDLIEQLERDVRAKNIVIGQLRREMSELRAVEPEALVIKDVLDYWRERCRPRASIAIGEKRWEKVRARLRGKLDDRDPLTPAELKLAVDGALLDRWHTQKGMEHRLDAEFLFGSYEKVEKLRDVALGFEADAGVALRDLMDVEHFRMVGWRLLLEGCVCGHRRVEHSRPDPRLEGQEGCFACECDDFTFDYCDPVNVRREEQRVGRAAA